MRLAIVIALLAISSGLSAHELQADRLTIVQRAPNHFSLTFLIDESTLLRRTLSPQATEEEFILSLAAMPEDRFSALVKQARSRFESELSIVSTDNRKMTLAAWSWPKPSRLQSEARTRAAQLIVGDAAHVHHQAAEIRVDAVSVAPIQRIQLKLPVALPELNVVSYRPVEQRYRQDQRRDLSVDFR